MRLAEEEEELQQFAWKIFHVHLSDKFSMPRERSLDVIVSAWVGQMHNLWLCISEVRIYVQFDAFLNRMVKRSEFNNDKTQVYIFVDPVEYSNQRRRKSSNLPCI